MREATAREMDRFIAIASVETRDDEMPIFEIWPRGGAEHPLGTVTANNRCEAVAKYLDGRDGRLDEHCTAYNGKPARFC